MQIALSILLACIPAFIWGGIFYKKDPVSKLKAKHTFILGMLAVAPILLYKWSWKFFPGLNINVYTDTLQTDLLSFSSLLYLPLGKVIMFMFVGVIEEYMKHLVVKKTDQGYFRNIDDAIEFSIISALGFAFIENSLYLYYIWEYQGIDVMMVSFVFRAIFSTFAHILFSGVYGYFYGVAYFADPIWSEEVRKKRHSFINLLHTIFHFKRNRVFATEKLSEGLMLAIFLHASFDILLEMNQTFFMVPFLVLGYGILDELFKRKENLKAYGYLTGEYSETYAHERLWQRLHKKAVALEKTAE
jgi:RsiW-degrading membrane proteinase PrsW (M82 family)